MKILHSVLRVIITNDTNDQRREQEHANTNFSRMIQIHGTEINTIQTNTNQNVITLLLYFKQ